jgi:DNA replicative helicase MCM subunit Mcm2 (Cdc46/Mcm family)
MFPGYKQFLNFQALRNILRQPDIPNSHLGIGSDEVLENIEAGQRVKTMPVLRREVVTGGMTAGQTYEGVSGWGTLIPDVTPGDIPYYGEYIGEV